MTLSLCLLLALCVCIGVWLRTGYDALYWMIRGLIWLRAALHLAGRVIAEAARTWRRALPDTVSEMRREMAE